MTVPTTYRNPPRSVLRRTLTAVGLGFGVAGIGLTLGDIYGRPSVGAGGVVLGLGVGAFHMPWSEILGGPNGSSSR